MKQALYPQATTAGSFEWNDLWSMKCMYNTIDNLREACLVSIVEGISCSAKLSMSQNGNNRNNSLKVIAKNGKKGTYKMKAFLQQKYN